MIPVLGQILAVFAAASLDSSATTLRLIGGASLGQRVSPALWGDLGVQLDVNPLFVRYGFAVGAPGFLDLQSRRMAVGQKEPDLEAYHNSFAAGYLAYWRSGWFGFGGGWAWSIVDTLGTASESRDLYLVSDGNATRSEAPAAWVWKDRVRRNGPFGLVEMGFGLRPIGMALRLEVGRSAVLGWDFQYRFL